MVDTAKVILRKKEAVYGTDIVPVVGSDAALTRNFQAEPIVVDNLDRNLDRASRGRTRSANTNERSTFSYELELAGSGAAGTAPAWMIDLEACGMAAPILTATTKAEQKFAAIGAALSSVSTYYWSGNQQVKALGVRGTFGLNFTAGAYPFITLDMMGLVPAVPLTTGAPGTPDFSDWVEPFEVHTRSTDFTLDGFAAVLQSFTLDANADIRPRNLVGSNYVVRGNHAATGRIRIEAPDLASKNYFSTLRTGAEITTELIHGIVPGNIVELKADHLQILKIARAEEDDILMLDMTVGLNINTGADDLLLTAK